MYIRAFKRVYLILVVCTLTNFVKAQTNLTKIDLQGFVYVRDNTEKTPLPSVLIQCFTLPDTTENFKFSTNSKGYFNESTYLDLKNDTLLISLSYIGMKSRKIAFEGETYINEFGFPVFRANMDTIWMEPQPITMREALIVEKLRKMYMSGDTVLFRTDAYEMPKGSMLLDLVRRLPGLECSEDGKLTYLGKSIDELRLNGKEFFKHDATIALRNMPVEHLKYLKIYEELKGDSLTSGVDDKQTIMDMETKEPVDAFLAGNLKGGKTAEDNDYMGQGDFNWHKAGKGEASIKAEFNSLPSSLTSLGKFTTINNYFTESRQEKSVGALFSRFGNKANVRGNIDYAYKKTGDRRLVSDETYLQDNSQIEQSENTSVLRDQTVRGIFDINGHGKRINWNVNARLNHTRTQGEDRGLGETYAASYGTGDGDTEPVRELLNSMRNNSRVERTRKTADITGNMSYRFGKGKNKSLALDFGLRYADADEMNRDYTSVTFQHAGTLHTYDRISRNLSNQTQMNIGLSYAQSLGERSSINLRYQYGYDRNHDDKDYFDLASDNPDDISGHKLYIPDNAVRNEAYSYLNCSDEQRHELSLRLSARFSKWNMVVSCGLAPTLQHVDYEQESRQNDTMRVTIVYSPKISTTYHNGKHTLSLSYTATNLPPGIDHLLPVPNNDDPLTIKEGNEKLKPSVSHGGMLSYNYDRWLSLSADWNGTANETSTLTTYEPETGVRHMRDVNVSGNWTANGLLRLSRYAGDFNYALSTSYHHEHRTGFFETADVSVPRKTVTRSHRFSFCPSAGYAHKGFEATLKPLWSYDVLGSQGYEGRRTQRYTLDLNVAYTFNFGLGAYSSYGFNAYKGFNATGGKDKEHIWNLGVSFNTWKNRLTVKAEGYDLLGQQSGFSYLYYPNGKGRREVRNFAKASYVLFTMVYHFTTLKSHRTLSDTAPDFFSSPNVIIVR